MISREDLFNRINYLLPEAKFSFWLDDGVRDKIDMGDKSLQVKVFGWVVYWHKDNPVPCPSEQDIQMANIESVNADASAKEKRYRNVSKADDLSLIALYNVEFKSNPNLGFSEYLDSL